MRLRRYLVSVLNRYNPFKTGNPFRKAMQAKCSVDQGLNCLLTGVFMQNTMKIKTFNRKP